MNNNKNKKNLEKNKLNRLLQNIFIIFFLGILIVSSFATANAQESESTTSVINTNNDNSFALSEQGTYYIPGSIFKVDLLRINYYNEAVVASSVDIDICTSSANTDGDVNVCSVYISSAFGNTIEFNYGDDKLTLIPQYISNNNVVYFTYQLSKKAIPIPTNRPPVIDGISGPQELNMGESGTWSISAHDTDGKILSYTVDWGERRIINIGNSAFQKTDTINIQDSSFTHTYDTPGKYTVIITVTDESGQSAKTSTTILVRGTVMKYNDLAVSDIESTNNVHQGETMTFYITLKNYGVSNVNGYSINYEFGDGSGTGSATSEIIKPGDTIRLTVDHVYADSGNYEFTAQVGDSSLDKDSTNNKKKLDIYVAPLENQLPVNPVTPLVINSINGPTNLLVNNQYTWSLDINSGSQYTSYDVDWGDEPKPIFELARATSDMKTTQVSTLSHTYTNTGNYRITFTVRDDYGQSVQKTLNVHVAKSLPDNQPPTDKQVKLKQLYAQLLDIIQQIVALQ